MDIKRQQKKVKISDNDTTADFLENKLIIEIADIVLTKENTGGDEILKILLPNFIITNSALTILGNNAEFVIK